MGRDLIAPRYPSEPLDMPGARQEPRVELWLRGATLRERGGRAIPVIVKDLSMHGFCTEWPYLLERGTRIWLKLPGFDALGALVAWNRQFEVGCKFEIPLHFAVFERIVTAHARS